MPIVMAYIDMVSIVMACMVMACIVMAYMVMAYVVMACIVMAYIVMAYMVMAYIVMAYIIMAYIVMAYIVMAYIGMAYIVMAAPALDNVQAHVQTVLRAARDRSLLGGEHFSYRPSFSFFRLRVPPCWARADTFFGEMYAIGPSVFFIFIFFVPKASVEEVTTRRLTAPSCGSLGARRRRAPRHLYF